MDYGLAETMLAFGLPPVALAEADDWETWVVEPALPEAIVNLGAAQEANLELLAALAPDLILSTPWLARSEARLARIAPVETYAIYAPGVTSPYEASVTQTRRLAARLGRAAQGEALVAAAGAQMDAIRARRTARAPEPALQGPVLLVSFLDARHVRVYAPNGLFGEVMARCGVANGWTGETNYWGFAAVGIERLAEMNAARLIALEPVPSDAAEVLDRSPLWNSLPFVKAGHVQRIPAALMFGMLPSAMRFARLLDAALDAPPGNRLGWAAPRQGMHAHG
nr:ABC transporter substrate-binding protein [Ancylobacter crimeensis]